MSTEDEEPQSEDSVVLKGDFTDRIQKLMQSLNLKAPEYKDEVWQTIDGGQSADLVAYLNERLS